MYLVVLLAFALQVTAATPSVESISPRTVLGEGPHWDETEQVLYYVDLIAQEVHKYNPSTGEETVVQIEGGTVSIVIPIKDQMDKFLITMGRNVAIMTWNGVSNEPSNVEIIATVDDEEGKRENQLNDGKADPTGRLWFGTLGPTDSNGDYIPNKASLFSMSKDRKVTTQLTNVTVSNGLAWSPDNQTMYYIDSPTLKVDAFDFDAEKGEISNRRHVFDFNNYGIKNVPDGMTIDTNGNLWVACFGGSQVINVDPTTGELLQVVPIPSRSVSSVAFGGQNLDELYVTSGSILTSDEDLKSIPTAGDTFRVTETGQRGFPGQRVDL